MYVRARRHPRADLNAVRGTCSMLCAALISVLLLGITVLLLALLLWRAQSGRGRVQVVVLGDAGRSPRMQYHSLSLVEHGISVDLVGYGGECVPQCVVIWCSTYTVSRLACELVKLPPTRLVLHVPFLIMM